MVLLNITQLLLLIIILAQRVQPRDSGFESHMGHDHDYSYGTSTGWF